MKKLTLVAMLVACGAALTAQPVLPPPFPRTNATKLLETDRVVVWDIVWPKGQPTAMHRHVYDQVGTYYARGGRLITPLEGEARTAMTEVGGLSTTRKGTTHIEQGTTDPPLRAVFIELKRETASGLAPLPSSLRPAFPREGAKPLLDDARVAAWDFVWHAGSAPFTYRPMLDAVVVWLGTGTLRLTPQGAVPRTLQVVPGTMRYMTRGVVETEEVIEGAPRGIVFELK